MTFNEKERVKLWGYWEERDTWVGQVYKKYTIPMVRRKYTWHKQNVMLKIGYANRIPLSRE